MEDRFRKHQADDQLEFWPDEVPSPWRTRVAVVLGALLVLGLLFGPLVARAKVFSIQNLILCDTREQLTDILEASGKSGNFEDSKLRLWHYARMPNDQGESACAVMSQQAYYDVSNEFTKVVSVNPMTNELMDVYIVKVRYQNNGGVHIGFISLMKEALDKMTRLQQPEGRTL